MKTCGIYLGDNDATCPQLTCIRDEHHRGECDNVYSDAEFVAAVRAAHEEWNLASFKVALATKEMERAYAKHLSFLRMEVGRNGGLPVQLTDRYDADLRKRGL